MSGMQWVSLAMGALVMQTPAAAPDRYGSVPIHSKVSRSIFPLDWRGGDVRAAATAITNTELPRSLKYTRKALATDDGDYARSMLAYMLATPAFAWLAERADDWRERPVDWPPTRYEAKARAAGRRPVFLRFVRLQETS